MGQKAKELTKEQKIRLIRLTVEYATTMPKSICYCGHSGDGANSFHAGIIGHGACSVTGCRCKKFTWARWGATYKRFKEEAGI